MLVCTLNSRTASTARRRTIEMVSRSLLSTPFVEEVVIAFAIPVQ
jgi:hypothetical protein